MRFIGYVRCVGLSPRESRIAVAAENHLPHPSHCFGQFEGSASPIQVGDKNPAIADEEMVIVGAAGDQPFNSTLDNFVAK